MPSPAMTTWYRRAQIDYVSHYVSLYTAFNAWYREVTGKTNDREALNILRRGNAIWDAYSRGEALRALTMHMVYLVEFTQREPLSYATPHWRGEVSHTKDWPSLIEYWYRVRCLVVHGVEIRPAYVYLAYETLNSFMGEVIEMQQRGNSLPDCLQSPKTSV